MGLFRRIKRPVQGYADIVEANRPPLSGAAGSPSVKLRLDVPGVAPQIVTHRKAFAMPSRWPEVGMRVAVTVDADHPDRVDVDWESAFGHVRGGPLGVAAELAAGAVGAEIDLSTGPPGQDNRHAPDPDYERKIAELNAAYARGDITYEVMTAAIQRILGAA